VTQSFILKELLKNLRVENYWLTAEKDLVGGQMEGCTDGWMYECPKIVSQSTIRFER
jgi:hypothetical protein